MSANPQTSKNETYELADDGGIRRIAEYVLLNPWFWKDGDSPAVQIVSVTLQGSGRGEVEVSSSFFSGRELESMEREIAYDLEHCR
jgi:hypothetical protein